MWSTLYKKNQFYNFTLATELSIPGGGHGAKVKCRLSTLFFAVKGKLHNLRISLNCIDHYLILISNNLLFLGSDVRQETDFMWK